MRGDREIPLLPKTGQRQPMASANAGFAEDVFQVDFDGTGLNAEAAGNVTIAQTALDQFGDFAFAGGQSHLSALDEGIRVPEDTLFHPAIAGCDGTEADEQHFRFGGTAQDASRTRLEEAQCLGFTHGVAPNDRAGGTAGVTELLEEIHDRLGAETFVDDDSGGFEGAGQFEDSGHGANAAGKPQIAAAVEERANAFDGNGLGIADKDRLGGTIFHLFDLAFNVIRGMIG